MKALRSSDKAMARRIFASSNGGLSRLTNRFAWVLVGCASQIAVGAWTFRSLTMAGVTTDVKVMSSLPATKVSSDVARLGMIENSIASR